MSKPNVTQTATIRQTATVAFIAALILSIITSARVGLSATAHNMKTNKKKTSFIAAFALLVSSLFASSANAQDVKPPAISPADQAAIAQAVADTYHDDPTALDSREIVQSGSEYVDADGYLIQGKPVPTNIRFAADFKGPRAPSPAQMEKLTVADDFPDLPPDQWAAVVKQLDIADPEAAKRGTGFKPVPTSSGHSYMGIFPLYSTPYGGVQGTNSSPYWTMTAHPFAYVFVGPTMYPGDGCLEGSMLHQYTPGSGTAVYKAVFNHCTAVAGYSPAPAYGWVSLETRSSSWTAAYERTVWTATTYWEYIHVYNNSNLVPGDYVSCSRDYIYNFTIGAWQQKADACGSQQTGLWGNGWVGTETSGLWQGGAWNCVYEGKIRSDNIQYISGSPPNWYPATVPDAPFYNNVSPACTLWQLIRPAGTPGTGYQTWQ